MRIELSRASSGVWGVLAAAAVAACGGDGGPTGPSITCVTASRPLQVGQVALVDTGRVNSCAFLAEAGGSAEYLVVPFTRNFEGSGDFVVTVRGSQVSLQSAGGSPSRASAADAFHARLRAFEAELAQRGLPVGAPAARLSGVPTVGQVDSFWVIQNLEFDEDNPQPSDFVRIAATLKFIGAQRGTLLYVDDASPAGGLSQAELDSIGQVYDERLLPLALQTFGQVSDVDGDGSVTILISPYVNALTPDTATAAIVGFFFGLDLLFRSDTALGCPICKFSNEREMFYGIVPDTGGAFSRAWSRNRVKEILPPVFIHETQHMINVNEKVIVRGSRVLETLWLNEALSHIAEELAGDAFPQDPGAADDFYSLNFSRATPYLEDPWNHSLTGPLGTLDERGGGWIFLRWLGDQFGNAIYGQLVRTLDRGVRNVERRTGVSFFQLFGEFVVTLYSEDLTIPDLSDRFQVKKWALRSILTSGGSYALQPDPRTFSQLRGPGLTQTLGSSSPYHILASADGSGDLNLQVTGQAALAILRIQ